MITAITALRIGLRNIALKTKKELSIFDKNNV